MLNRYSNQKPLILMRPSLIFIPLQRVCIRPQRLHQGGFDGLPSPCRRFSQSTSDPLLNLARLVRSCETNPGSEISEDWGSEI